MLDGLYQYNVELQIIHLHQIGNFRDGRHSEMEFQPVLDTCLKKDSFA